MRYESALFFVRERCRGSKVVWHGKGTEIVWGFSLEEWAMSYALYPDFYGTSFNTRVGNTCLAGALFLSIAVAAMIAPPETLLDDQTGAEVVSASKQAFGVCLGIATAFLFFFVMLGILLQDAACRGFTQLERFEVLMQHWPILGMMRWGFGLIVIIMVSGIHIALYREYDEKTSFGVIAPTVVFVAFFLYAWKSTEALGGVQQLRRGKAFCKTMLDDDGHILPMWWEMVREMPEEVESLEDIEKMLPVVSLSWEEHMRRKNGPALATIRSRTVPIRPADGVESVKEGMVEEKQSHEQWHPASWSPSAPHGRDSAQQLEVPQATELPRPSGNGSANT